MNVSIKRAQSQTCLSFAEREKHLSKTKRLLKMNEIAILVQGLNSVSSFIELTLDPTIA
jgi:hypothetical protein